MAARCFGLQKLLARPLSSLSARENIVRYPFPPAEIPHCSLYPFVSKQFDSYASKTALVDGLTGKETSYNELQESVAKVGSSLIRNGTQPGDVIALASPNSVQQIVQLFASSAIGGVVSTVNPSFTAGEMAYQFKDCGAKYIATASSVLPQVKEAACQVGIPNDRIIVLDADGHGEHISFSRLLESNTSVFSKFDTNSIDPDAVAFLPYSSGTTGLPKGVMLSHRNMVSNLCQVDHPTLLDLRGPDTCALGILPFFHIYGLVLVLGLNLHQGNKIVTLPKFEPDTFLHALGEYKVTEGFLAPPLVVYLAKDRKVSNYKITSLRHIFCGAAPLSGEVAAEVRTRLNVRHIRQLYGTTETSPLVHGCPLGVDKPSSIGSPILNTEVAVLDDESGDFLGSDCVGELLVRGPQVMKGYLNRPDATRDAVTEDGFYRTGDLCYYDQDGHFYIVDRLKELIKVKGFQVAPAELEGLLLTHPQIADCAVVGVADERAGEVPRAFVVAKYKDLSERDVESFVASKLSKHKHLKGGVVFVESIPKSPSGKILRRLLRE